MISMVSTPLSRNLPDSDTAKPSGCARLWTGLKQEAFLVLWKNPDTARESGYLRLKSVRVTSFYFRRKSLGFR